MAKKSTSNLALNYKPKFNYFFCLGLRFYTDLENIQTIN